MIQANNISKRFGREVLFENITFSMTKGEKIGLTGRNGSGKSTLFRMMLGEIEADEGSIITPKGYRIGTLPQHINFTKRTVLEEGCTALGSDEEYDAYKVERILFGLGFSEKDMHRHPNEFSGGYQIRINLAKALVKKPDLLLLDEPTNYLDIISQEWLKQTIILYPGEVILITHDREFMDGATTHIMGLYRKRLRKLKGNTDNYYQKIEEAEELHAKAIKNQEKTKKHLQKYISRFRSSARRASQAQSRIKQLAKLKDLTALNREHNLEFSFNHTPCPGKTIMTAEHINFSYEKGQDLIHDISLTIKNNDRIGIIGKNGKGKSTLLNLLSGDLAPGHGFIWSHPGIKIGHFGQTNIARMHEDHTVEQEIALVNPNLSLERVRAICGTMMFSQDYALKKIQVLSGGERSRVLLGKILAHETNLLLLDEPTNHLDQESIEGLMDGIEAFTGAVVIVTHSARLLNELVDKLIVFHHGRTEIIPGSYDYFLEKYGWDEYDGAVTQAPAATQNISEAIIVNRKELKIERAAQREKISKKLNPLKTKIDRLEKEIEELEAAVETSNQEIIIASKKSNVPQFVALSKAIKAHQQEIDKKYKRLEKLTVQYDALTLSG
jgi:ATP-binding cassette, subfamily F, member 3